MLFIPLIEELKIVRQIAEVKSIGVVQTDEEVDILYKEAHLWLRTHSGQLRSCLISFG